MEKNQIFINYKGVVEFVTKTKEERNKKGEPYYIRSLAVNIDDVNPKYPVILVFDVLGNDRNMKKINMLDGISKGEDVVVKFTISSSPYVNGQGENKYFLKLNLIDVFNGEGNQSAGGGNKQQSAFEDPGFFEENNDMPF